MREACAGAAARAPPPVACGIAPWQPCPAIRRPIGNAPCAFGRSPVMASMVVENTAAKPAWMASFTLTTAAVGTLTEHPSDLGGGCSRLRRRLHSARLSLLPSARMVTAPLLHYLEIPKCAVAGNSTQSAAPLCEEYSPVADCLTTMPCIAGSPEAHDGAAALLHSDRFDQRHVMQGAPGAMLRPRVRRAD